MTEPQRDARVRVAVAGSLAAMVLYRISSNVADPDLYHQMALAREAIRLGTIPRIDAFAFTPVLPVVVHHEWGAGFVALGVALLLGGAGVLALKYGLAAALALVSLRNARSAGGTLAAIAMAVPVAIALADHGFSPVRAQLYTFLGAALTIACIERDRAGSRRWLPAHALVYVAWVNLHGGFVVGPLLLACHAVEAALTRRPARHVVALLAAEAGLGLANPWGPASYAFLGRALTMARARIHEWDPLFAPGAPAAQPFAFLLAAALVVYGLRRGGGPRKRGLVQLGVTGLMALRAQRMLPLFAITWLAYTPALLAGTPLVAMVEAAARRHARVVAVIAATSALLFVVLLARSRPWILEVPERPAGSLGNAQLAYPVGATRFLRASGFHGRLMTTFETGGYVSWKLHPDVKVSLDGRYEAAYPEAVFDDVMAFYEGRAEPRQVVSRYRPDAVLVPPGAGSLRARLAWPCAYDDGSFAVLVRPGLALAAGPAQSAAPDRFP